MVWCHLTLESLSLVQAFSMNGKPTIVPTEKGAKIGQRSSLSPLDIKQANMLYNCTGEAAWDTHHTHTHTHTHT